MDDPTNLTSATGTGLFNALVVWISFAQTVPVIGAAPQPQDETWREAFSHPAPDHPPPREQWSLPSEAEAIRAASAYLGDLCFVRGELELRQTPAPAQASLVRLQEDAGPFALTGTEVWEVRIPKIDLLLPTLVEQGGFPLPSRSVMCHLEPVTGKLLRVQITNDENPEQAAPAEPSGRDYLDQLRAVGPEIWGALPDHLPPVSLSHALGDVDKRMGGVLAAKSIVVYYVVWRFGVQVPDHPDPPQYRLREVWSIDLRGIQPPDGERTEVPLEARNHVRHIIDATTGEWIMASTVPQPPQPKEDEPSQDVPRPVR